MKPEQLKFCLLCGESVNKTGQIMFYRIKLDSMILDLRAMQQLGGLATFFGGGLPGVALANVMGPRDDIAKQLWTKEACICMDCVVHGKSLAHLVDVAGQESTPEEIDLEDQDEPHADPQLDTAGESEGEPC